MILARGLLASVSGTALLLAGCGAVPHAHPLTVPHDRPVELPADEVPLPIGRGPGFRLIVVDRGQARTLKALFAVWGQPLSSDRLAGFRGPVEAFLGGRRWRGAPGEIPLRRHAEIVLELGGHIPPHPAYRFAPGL